MNVANYHEQRDELAAFGGPSCTALALVLTGKAEFGKSWLIDWLGEACAATRRVVRIELDHPQRVASPRLVMTKCADALGREFFDEFLREQREIQPAAASISNNTVSGSYINITAAAGGTLEDQLALAVSLTGAFLEGLKAAAAAGPPIIICLDGLKADQWLCNQWLEEAFLDGLYRSRAARVVITGREPPSDTVMLKARKPRVLPLAGVFEIEEWKGVAKEMRRALPGKSPEFVDAKLEAIVEYAEGEPGGIMAWLQSLPVRSPE